MYDPSGKAQTRDVNSIFYLIVICLCKKVYCLMVMTAVRAVSISSAMSALKWLAKDGS